MTNRSLSAQEAHEWGLVARVVPEGKVMEAALALAEEIRAMPPLSIKAVKEAVNRGMDGYEYACRVFENLMQTEDAKEGAQAFLEKRKPHFKGR